MTGRGVQVSLHPCGCVGAAGIQSRIIVLRANAKGYPMGRYDDKISSQDVVRKRLFLTYTTFRTWVSAVRRQSKIAKPSALAPRVPNRTGFWNMAGKRQNFGTTRKSQDNGTYTCSTIIFSASYSFRLARKASPVPRTLTTSVLAVLLTALRSGIVDEYGKRF